MILFFIFWEDCFDPFEKFIYTVSSYLNLTKVLEKFSFFQFLM